MIVEKEKENMLDDGFFGGVLVWHTPWKNLCEGCWDISASLGSMVTGVDVAHTV